MSNRYGRKCKHKDVMKRNFCASYYRAYSKNAWDRIKNQDNDTWWKKRYWLTYYLSGCRKIAKKSTNRKIRGIYRNITNAAELDILTALSNADYRKYFDYDWTIW